jgi:RNA polymerase sigma-70 factor (ECF subfamily)
MDRYLAGENEAYGQLVRRYERELFNYLMRMLGDVNLAEDVFQNTFLTVHVKRHLFGVGRPFRPWLYTLATNQAIDALRRNGRHSRPSLDQSYDRSDGDAPATLMDMISSPSGQPSEHAEREELARIIRTSVDSLPEHLRTTIVMCYYQGLKYKDIGDALDIPVGTVKSRLHAAILRLSDTWKRLGLLDPEE